MSKVVLSEDQRDALQELTNIAMGQAGASLATLLDAFVDLSIPRIRVAEVVELPPVLSELVGPHNEASAVRQSFQGYLRGEAIVIFGGHGTGVLADLMGYEGELGADGEAEPLLDVANVLSGACLGGLLERHGHGRLTARPHRAAGGTEIAAILADHRVVAAFFAARPLHGRQGGCPLVGRGLL
jgi:chemotaxis protein CheC